MKKVYQLGAPRNRLTISELSIFRVAGSPTLKMRTSLNIKLLRVAPRALLFTSYTQNHKHGYVTLHSFLNLLSQPIYSRHHLPQYHIHTGHHKLCLPLCF